MTNLRSFFIFNILLCIASVASAEEPPFHTVSVYCNPQTNAFYVQLNESQDMKQLLAGNPLKLDSAVKPGAKTCRFNDGTNLTIDSYETQSFAYGQGGADPDSRFTLWYKGTPLYYEATYYQGYGGPHAYNLDAIMYDGKHLKACAGNAVEPEPGKAKPSYCVDVSLRLKGHGAGYTQEEKDALKREEVIKSIDEKLSPWCRQFKKARPYSFEDLVPSGGYIKVDLANDGKMSRVFSIESNTHYFDGSYLIVIPESNADGVTYERLVEKILVDLNEENPALGTPALKQHKGRIISVDIKDLSPRNNMGEVSHRYIYNHVITYQKNYYILSQPMNESVLPHWVLSRVLPDDSLETLCVLP